VTVWLAISILVFQRTSPSPAFALFFKFLTRQSTCCTTVQSAPNLPSINLSFAAIDSGSPPNPILNF